ncbi:uncharacterized protein LOC127856275 [Dreissena polymorpha]|uniref:B box-type domain-containing protein n=1 Tax=Dreissena polymorpha TaxID=45954 RepID=A0A9D4HK40_DREPO|nr:uncharacterized protein LOC127856275 [Dreissena polymorpha]KAH3720408.1 hypothetical protein DPMN_063307 [Dreissena polymorpha]
MATFSQSTVDKGCDSFTDFCCSPCLEHNIDQWAEFYCDNCLKFYCGECLNLHGQLFSKHVAYGRGDTSKWPVSKEVEDFLQKCDLHEDKRLEMFCHDHSELCCTSCAFLNHRLCAQVTPISESVDGPPPDLQQLSRKIKTILETLKKLEKNWNTNMQTVQASYNKQLLEIREPHKKINTILDNIEKNTIKELDDKLTSLKASIKTDADNCSKLKNELKQLSDAVYDIVDKGKSEHAFIASRKCLEKLKQSETYLKENSSQVESSLTFQADIDILHYLSKLQGLGRIVLSTVESSVLGGTGHVFTVQGWTEHDMSISSDLYRCDIGAVCVLSDDTTIVADGSNKLIKLLDHQYRVVAICDLSAPPKDICQITQNEVAVVVVYDKTQGVQFVDVNGVRLVKGRKLRFQHSCNGIAHNLQELYLTSGTALYKYSMKGALLKKLHEDTSDNYTVWKCAVSPSGDTIFITNQSHSKVHTLDRDGLVLNTFTDPDLKNPYGMHVTALGQVLVCGGVSHNTLQLDGEGKKKLATLATKREGLWIPQSVCYNTSTASIIVGQLYGNQIFVFKVK